MTQSLHQQLLSFVGHPAEPRITARDEVNEAMIRAWCDAVGDHNPVYLDAGSPTRRILAPPSFVMCWFFPAVGTARPPAGSNLAAFTDLLKKHGFNSVLATNIDQTHHRYAELGDKLTLSWTISDISTQKSTALGNGFFLTTHGTIETDDDVLCTMEYRRLYFAPS
jgi:acyl dehydratase